MGILPVSIKFRKLKLQGYILRTWTWGMEYMAKSFKYRTTTSMVRSFQPNCQQFINSIDSFDVWFVLYIASFWGHPKVMNTTVRILKFGPDQNLWCLHVIVTGCNSFSFALSNWNRCTQNKKVRYFNPTSLFYSVISICWWHSKSRVDFSVT